MLLLLALDIHCYNSTIIVFLETATGTLINVITFNHTNHILFTNWIHEQLKRIIEKHFKLFINFKRFQRFFLDTENISHFVISSFVKRSPVSYIQYITRFLNQQEVYRP